MSTAALATEVPVRTGRTSLTLWGGKTLVVLHQSVLALDSAVTQMTSAAHGGDFLPSTHCLIPAWETLLLHVIYTVSCSLAGVYPEFHHLLTMDWENKNKKEPLPPKLSCLHPCLKSLCSALIWGLATLVVMSHTCNSPSTLLLCLFSYTLPQL